MSSVKKGDALEDSVFAQLSQELEAGRLGFLPGSCKIFQKKGYYSKDRESEIIFDIAIEVYRPGESSWTQLVLVECKNYAHRVPVSDVEEFFQKTQQVSAGAVKAIVVTSNAYQDGAFAFARSKHIGLVRYFPDAALDWVLNRAPSTLRAQRSLLSSAMDALASENYVSRYCSYYCIFGKAVSTSLAALVQEVLASSPESLRAGWATISSWQPVQTWVPFIPAVDIESLAMSFVQKFTYQSMATPLEALSEYLTAEQGLQIRHLPLPTGTLARVHFDQLAIELDPSQNRNDARARFSLGHELGHICLEHGQFMKLDTLRDVDTDEDALQDIAFEDIARLEWQANYFASCLLLPRGAFVTEVKRQAKMRNIKDKGFGLLFLDHQRCNIEAYRAVSTAVAIGFNVSRQVVKIRLVELGLLNDVTSPKPTQWLSPRTRPNQDKCREHDLGR